MDSRAKAAVAESSDLCLGDALCRAHYKRARTLSGDGDFQAALEAYQTAYRRRAASWLLLSIGRTSHKLGRPSEALGYYNQYKEKEPHPSPELETRLNEYIKEVQEELAGTPTPTPAKPSPAPGSVQSKATPERSEGVVPPAAESDSTTAEPAPPGLLNTPQPTLPAPMTDASPVLPRIPLLPRFGEVTPGRMQSDHDSGAKPLTVRSRSNGIAAGSVLGALGLVGIATGLGFYAQTDRSQFSLTGDEFDKLALLNRSQSFQVASTIGFSVGAALLATGVGMLGYSAYKARHKHADRPRIALFTKDRRFMLGLTGVY